MNRQQIEAKALELLIRCDDQNASEEQLRELREWISADPSHEAAYVRAERAWKRCDRLQALRPSGESIDVAVIDKAMLKLKHPPWWKLTPRPAAMVARAVAVVAALMAGALWSSYPLLSWHTYTTGIGEHRRVELDDGSTVSLNTSSVLRVHMTRERRHLALVRGEALFKVAHDPQRPFDVSAGETVVRAIGTEFSMRVHGGPEAGASPTVSPGVDVLVKEGRVAINPPPLEEISVKGLPPAVPTLSAGEAVTVLPKLRASQEASKSVEIRKLAQGDVSRRLSWVEGRLWFERETLANVVDEFNRYNNRKLVIADPAIAELRIGGGFVATDTDSFMAALESTLHVRIDRNDEDAIRIYGAGFSVN